MEINSNQNGRMTIDKADAIRAFIRQVDSAPGDAINREAARLGPVDKDHALKYGAMIIEESKLEHPNLFRVKELISNGADLNARDPEGNTSLIYACVSGNLEIAELLLKAART